MADEIIHYKAEIRKIGNSYAVIVPAYMRKAYDLPLGAWVEIAMKKIDE